MLDSSSEEGGFTKDPPKNKNIESKITAHNSPQEFSLTHHNSEENIEERKPIQTDQYNQISLSTANKIVCKYCKSPELDKELLTTFNITVCRSCKYSKSSKIKLITKTTAAQKYLLSGDDIKHLKYLKRPNPHKATWNDMHLYLENEIIKIAKIKHNIVNNKEHTGSSNNVNGSKNDIKQLTTDHYVKDLITRKDNVCYDETNNNRTEYSGDDKNVVSRQDDINDNNNQGILQKSYDETYYKMKDVDNSSENEIDMSIIEKICEQRTEANINRKLKKARVNIRDLKRKTLIEKRKERHKHDFVRTGNFMKCKCGMEYEDEEV